MFYTMTRLIQQRYVTLTLPGVMANQACSAEKHGMHGGDKSGPPPGATLNRGPPEKESSGGCC